MFRVNIPLKYSFDVGVDGFELNEIDVAPELMEKWELHWYPQNLGAEERRIRVLHKQFEEFFTMQKRIFAEVPDMLHEVKVLHDIVASKKECKADDAAQQLVVDERKEQERQKRLADAQGKLAKRQNCMKWRGAAPAPASAPAPTSAPTQTPAAAAPAPDLQQLMQMFQQFAGVHFAPVQPPPQVAAAPVFVKQEAPAGSWSPERKRKSSDSEDEGDATDLGEAGGPADMRDKELEAAAARKEEARFSRKKPMKKHKRARKPIQPTKTGKPDRRQHIEVWSSSDDLDEKHVEPMPSTQPAPMPPAEPVNIPLPSTPMEQQPAPAVVPDPVPPTPSVEPANSACPSAEPAAESTPVPPSTPSMFKRLFSRSC